VFRLPLDLGKYDIAVKPRAGSGWAWEVIYDVDIRTRAVDFSTVIEMGAPLVLQGNLHFAASTASSDSLLAGSEIRAYAFVDDNGAQRAVAVGRAVAEAGGAFKLLLPASLRRGWYGTAAR
jgi:hypothetical protein